MSHLMCIFFLTAIQDQRSTSISEDTLQSRKPGVLVQELNVQEPAVFVDQELNNIQSKPLCAPSLHRTNF